MLKRKCKKCDFQFGVGEIKIKNIICNVFKDGAIKRAEDLILEFH